MTIDQIVAAIRALPVPERLRVIELVAHDAANDAPVAEAESASPGSALEAVAEGQATGLITCHALAEL